MKINEAVQHIIDIANLQSEEDLNIWCGDRGREKLYERVKLLAPEHWEELKKPDCGVRAYYQTKLIGYKRYRNRV
jgi:hypothetical protein